MRTRVLVAAGLILSLTSASAFAQTKVDRSFTTTAKDCSSVQWSAEAKATYPRIAEACQSVEERNGKNYVKFQGKVQKNINRGEQLAINFKDGGTMTVSPPADMVLYVAGRKTPVKALSRGDELTFYVPEDRFTAQFRDEETQQVAEAPIMRVVYEERRVTQVLPETAGQTAWLAFAGAILLAMGAGLTMRRRQRH